jgi:translocation and assembly module TamB
VSRVSTLSVRLLAALVLVAAAVALGALVLTQTQVGRDEVARQVERQFARQFQGEVEIGRLTGNLLRTLHGRDVVLRDPEGGVVLRADSIVLEPHWRSLFSNRLELRRLTLIRPALDLVRDAEGRWNLARALEGRRVRVPDPDGRPLDLSAAEIRLIDGTVLTRNLGEPYPAVRSGVLFDFTNTRAEALDALLDLQFEGRDRRLRVVRFAADLPGEGLRVESLTGLLALTPEGLLAEPFALALPGTRLEGRFALRVPEGPDRFTLALSPNPVDGSELRRIVPAFPLAGAFTLAADLDGPLSDLALNRLAVSRGGSQVSASGRLALAGDSLRYALTLDAPSLTPGDLAALVPEASDVMARLGRVRGDMEARGVVTWGRALRTDTDARLRLASEAGGLRGQLRLRTAEGAPLRYAFDGRADGLDPGRLTGDPTLSGAITGRVALDGQGLDPSALAARLRLDLGPSRLAGRALDALAADLTLRGQALSGSATLDADGRVALSGTADLAASRFDITADATGLNLQALAPEAPASRLTGRAYLTASGRTLDDLSADLDLRLVGSTLAVGGADWAVPEDSLHLALRPAGADGPRLHLDSEALSVDLSGDFQWAEAVPFVRWWAEHVAATLDAEVLHARADGPRPSPEPGPIPVASPQTIRLAATVRQEHVLRPWLRAVAPGTEATVDLHADPDSLRLAVRVDADRLDVGTVRFGALRASVDASAPAEGALLDGLALRVAARADSLGPAALTAPPIRPRLLAEYHPGVRALDLRADAFRPSDSARVAVDAAVALLADRARFTGRLALDAPDQQWRLERGVVDLYTDALVFEAFEAARTAGPSEAAAPSRLALAGPASALPSDTLHVLAETVDLSELLAVLGLNLPFDGSIAADLAVSAALGQPVLLGDATVDRFALWGDVAGRVTARSEIVPGREGFAVDLRIEPESDTVAIRNVGRLAGTLALPGRTPEGDRDPGFFDLRADLERLDLFFFDHFFPELIADTHGGATGTGTITGDWSFPLFNADLRFAEGRTTVPDFNLALAAEGAATIDRRGIHLRDVRLADKSGGTGRLQGSILFNEYRYFSLDLAANLTAFEVIDVNRQQAGTLPFYGHIRASGSATLTGPLDAAVLRAPDAVTTSDSQIFIPVVASGPTADAGFLVFADAEGRIPEAEERRSLIGDRPETERAFLAGLQMNLNVFAPPGSTVHLVFDPLIGDVITAVGSATMQLAIVEDQFLTFGTFDVERGQYLFTAGDVFTRRFELEPGGTLVWDGDPIDARLDLPAAYRTRAAVAGLGLPGVDERQRVPVVVRLDVSGRVTGPLVALSLALDEAAGRQVAAGEALRLRLNEPDRQAEYATSVLLTNTFLLAPSEGAATLGEAADDLLFTSLSELVSSRLSLFLNQALGADNLDVALGLQQGVNPQEFDFTYGLALRLLDERLVIRGEGVYQQLENRTAAEGLQGEVAVEVRLAEGVALEVFYRREGDPVLGSGLATLPTGAYGAGLTYRTEFSSWAGLLRRLRGAPPPEAPATADASPP